PVRIRAYSYHRFSERVDRDVNARVHACARALVAQGVRGILDVIPGYNTLLVEFDRALTSAARVRKLVERYFEGASESSAVARTVTVPVVYDGPDLEDVAARAGLTPVEVARVHAASEYHVYAVGFTPGFPFLGDVAPE